MFNDFHQNSIMEALWAFIHEAAILREGEYTESRIVIVNNMAFAFVEAAAARQVYVELPDKNKKAKYVKRDHGGYLKMSLYGTWDAMMN